MKSGEHACAMAIVHETSLSSPSFDNATHAGSIGEGRARTDASSRTSA
jgi:hypothetical protein